jgi:SAM-dependent methyltransferase
MHEALYDELRSIEEMHWWLTARRRLLLDFLRRVCRGFSAPPRLLDCGCGTGRLLRHLAEFARPVGVDDWPHRAPAGDEAGRCAFVRARIEELPFGDGAFDVVCAFDVLEHLDDDAAALLRLRRLLRAGGYLVLSVPAYRFLWDAQDDLAGHRRRYRLRELRRKLRRADFAVERATYFNTLLFPPAALVRLWRKARAWAGSPPAGSDFGLTPPGALNDLLRRIFLAEIPLLRRLDLPFGGSILCIARRA